MASQASRIAEGRHRRVPPVGMLGAQLAAETRRAAGRAGNRAALRLRGPGFRRRIAKRLGGTAMAEDKLRDRARLEPAQPPRLAGRRRCARRSPRSTPVSASRRSAPRPRSARPGAASPMPSRSSRASSTPDELLAELKAIERDFGRRPGRRWGPRVLDLDIILWSGGAWGGPGPIVPHPEFRDRAFVLAAARRDRARLARPAHRRHRPPAPRPVDRAPPRA